MSKWKGVKYMELQIEKRRYQEGNRKDEAIVESIATFPYESGSYDVQGLGSVNVLISEFNQEKGTEKVLLVSEALRTKKSEDRRIVEFPYDIKTSVSQELTPTEILVFKRVK